MPSRKELILKIALDVPLRRCFDYLAEENLFKTPPRPGIRVKVPFGKSKLHTGIVLGVSQRSEIPVAKLKRIIEVIDQEPVFDPTLLQLLEWAGSYYQHPIGEVLFGALPPSLRRGEQIKSKSEYTWELTATGRQMDSGDLRRAPSQTQLLNMLQSRSAEQLQFELKNRQWRAPLQALLQKGIVQKCALVTAIGEPHSTIKNITLNNDQKQAVAAVCEHLGVAKRYLLYGVTGSGKTEVYIEIIKKVIAAGRQALVLVPEIGLTPQLIQRLRDNISTHVAVLHSALSAGERLQAWIEAGNGTAAIILGTRSAVWVPLQNPGVIIIDEEHDLSYKQQDSFRYSARDVAVMRAKLNAIPVILGSATPSMESIQNAQSGKFISLTLTSRTGTASHPSISIIDMRGKSMFGAFSGELVEAIAAELRDKQQVLLFLNQRGYSPLILCHACGWMLKCPRCDTRMIYHKHFNTYTCHRCNSQSRPVRACPECSAQELLPIGHGTERLAETLAELFPTARILRIDRDSTRRKGSMQKMLDQINAGDADILIGTQMLAKGHHFPKLTLVGIIDSDRGLFSTDFRVGERLAQLFIQVSGRAGRENLHGKVIIQTHYPRHPLILSMVNYDYHEFSKVILRERQETNLPPFSYLALLRAEDYHSTAVERFLTEAKNNLSSSNTNLEIFGPMPAIVEKQAGRFRYQLLIQSSDRYLMQRTLEPWCKFLENLKSAKNVRWSLDIDPQELV
ncbi:MAG: primosomal protein N' [Gammaproteobacteria bacterium]|nr:primosomal protein N' [Gammaproteobacteria bacterium]